MRFTITFFSEGPVELPLSYNETLQGFIYSHLNEVLGTFLHDRGFTWEKRHFKLFTFSRLIGRVRVVKGAFQFTPPLRLTISSPYSEILQSLAENLITREEIRLGRNRLHIASINVHFLPSMDGELTIRMLSPVTIYSTLKKGDGSKKTYYYNPYEDEFQTLLRENIIKKYRAFYEREPAGKDLSIEPLKVSRKDEKIILYKNFVIKGWMGVYRLKGHPELLKLAYDAGLGAKNSQGFGCFEVVG